MRSFKKLRRRKSDERIDNNNKMNTEGERKEYLGRKGRKQFINHKMVYDFPLPLYYQCITKFMCHIN